jgi:hypothetical protein
MEKTDLQKLQEVSELKAAIYHNREKYSPVENRLYYSEIVKSLRGDIEALKRNGHDITVLSKVVDEIVEEKHVKEDN